MVSGGSGVRNNGVDCRLRESRPPCLLQKTVFVAIAGRPCRATGECANYGNRKCTMRASFRYSLRSALQCSLPSLVDHCHFTGHYDICVSILVPVPALRDCTQGCGGTTNLDHPL